MSKKNPLIEANRRAMEFIWSKCPKTLKDDEEYVVYEPTDIPALYYSGLVDTERYKLKHWEQAFEDCKDEDGRLWVSRQKMIFLGIFRYNRRVGEPFDPLKMRVGLYQPDRLWNVFEKSIMPSCSLPQQFLKNTFDQIFRQHKTFSQIFKNEIDENKEAGEDVDEEQLDAKTFNFINGKGGEMVNIKREHLIHLKNLVDTYPSPRRKMEIGVLELRTQQLQGLADQAKQSQKSAFKAGKDFREVAKSDLKSMLIKASENVTGGRKPKDEVIDLKSLQNKNRPTKY